MRNFSPQKTVGYFARHFGAKRSTNGWWIFDNPFDPDGAGRQKMAVHPVYQVVKCWRTDWRGSVHDFVMDFEGVDYRRACEILEAAEATALAGLEDVAAIAMAQQRSSSVQMPKGFTPLREGTGSLGKRARAYLSGRGFDIDLLDGMGFGYCREAHEDPRENYLGRIIIPFRRDGLIVYYIGRDYLGLSDLRYKNPSTELVGVGKGDVLFNETALDLCSKVYITEGWSDALTLGEEGTATLGWSVSHWQRMRYINSPAQEIVLVPDIGSGGLNTRTEAFRLAAALLPHKRVKVLDLSAYSHLGKDANEIGRGNVLESEYRTAWLDEGSLMMGLIGL